MELQTLTFFNPSIRSTSANQASPMNLVVKTLPCKFALSCRTRKSVNLCIPFASNPFRRVLLRFIHYVRFKCGNICVNSKCAFREIRIIGMLIRFLFSPRTSALDNHLMDEKERKTQLFAIRLSLAVGVIMLAGKWYAYAITGSAAILSDAAESVVHIMAVGFAAFSVWLMYRPPDESHPYGHDKISFFSAGVEGFLIILAAAFIIFESIKKLIHAVELTNLDIGTYVVFAASVINLVLGGYLVWQGKQSKSLILVANGKHVLTDSWTSFGVVLGLVLVMFTGWLPFDPIIASAVALNIVWSGGKLIRQAVGGLMDEADPEVEQSIREVLDAETSKRGLQYHELRYRESGNSMWVEYHVLFPEDTRLQDAHNTATEIEAALSSSLQRPARIISHLEPTVGHDEVHVESLRHSTLRKL